MPPRQPLRLISVEYQYSKRYNDNRYMDKRKSIGMKNFIFKSQNNFDLQKFSLKLEIMQKEMRHQRDDLTDIKRRLTRIITIMTAETIVQREDEPPEVEYPEEEIGTDKDIPEGA